MLILAVDSSTPTVVAGLVQVNADGSQPHTVAQRILPDCRHHNEELTPAVQVTLAEAQVTFADLDAVVVGCGPGPFTGLRVGMASAAAYGDALGIPVHGVCSLDAIYHQLPQTGAALVATDARRREVYWACYRDGARVTEPEVSAPGDVEKLLPEHPDRISIPGYLAEQLGPLADHSELCEYYPLPEALVACADLQETPGPLVPLYLRRPDAKEPKPKPKSPAIPDLPELVDPQCGGA